MVKIVNPQSSNSFNITAETGDFPKALIHGILCPLQKSGKKKCPPENLRPAILLSILRKVLTISLLHRIWNRLAEKNTQDSSHLPMGKRHNRTSLSLEAAEERASYPAILIYASSYWICQRLSTLSLGKYCC